MSDRSTPASTRSCRRLRTPFSATKRHPHPMSLPVDAIGHAGSVTGFSLGAYIERLDQAETMPLWGRVVRTVGLLIESNGPRVSVGTMCEIQSSNGAAPLPVQVVGFRDGVMQA